MRTTRMRCAWMVAALVAAAPAGLTADTVSVEQAVEMERQAAELAADRERMGDAAELYRKAAALRPEGDPVAVRDLRQAGRLSWYAGKEERALRTLAEAAETALRYGDVLTAAETFLDAAWVAERAGDADRTLRYARQGRDLSHSPLIAERDRERLRERIAQDIAN